MQATQDHERLEPILHQRPCLAARDVWDMLSDLQCPPDISAEWLLDRIERRSEDQG